MKIALLFALLLSLPAYADDFFEVERGAPPDHLTPLHPSSSDYDLRIAKHLFLTNGDLGRFLTLPSFTPESCVSVHAEASDELIQKYGNLWNVPEPEKKYFITATLAAESLYYSMAENNDRKTTKEVRIARFDREISRPLAVAIQHVWARVLLLTRYPTHPSSGLDGVAYQFSVWLRGLGELSGEAWSPKEGLPAEMASLGDALEKFAVDKQQKEQPLLERLQAFETKIPQP